MRNGANQFKVCALKRFVRIPAFFGDIVVPLARIVGGGICPGKGVDKPVKKKAIEIANAMVDEGYDESRAIPIATSQAKEWADNRSKSELTSYAEKADETERGDSGSSSRPELAEKCEHVIFMTRLTRYIIRSLPCSTTLRRASAFLPSIVIPRPTKMEKAMICSIFPSAIA